MPPRLLHSFARPAAGADTYITIVGGEGAEVVDAVGRRYIDALASLWYCNIGHGRREVVEAIAGQAGRLAGYHTFDRFTNEPADALAERLARLAPMPDARVFFTSGGSEAVDTAIKLARIAHHIAGDPARTLVVSRRPSYHGVTLGSLALTGLPANQEGFGPLMGHALQVDHDDLAALDQVLSSHGDQVAAIVAEPVIGAGGVRPPSPGYLAGLRERCDAYGALLVLDEVICGFGRLGAWWGSEVYDVVPDLVTFAKGVTSGYQPLGGVLVGRAVRDRLEADESFVLRHGHTYSGHPVACAAGIANLEVLADDDMFAGATRVGEVLEPRLSALVDGERVVDVRGRAGIWAVECGGAIDAVAMRDQMLDDGVIVRPLGANTIALCPPLVITDPQLEQIVDSLTRALPG